MSRNPLVPPPAFNPPWSADQFVAAADAQLHLSRAALARFALLPSANHAAATPPATSTRPVRGRYAPLSMLTPFRIGA